MTRSTTKKSEVLINQTPFNWKKSCTIFIQLLYTSFFCPKFEELEDFVKMLAMLIKVTR